MEFICLRYTYFNLKKKTCKSLSVFFVMKNPMCVFTEVNGLMAEFYYILWQFFIYFMPPHTE